MSDVSLSDDHKVESYFQAHPELAQRIIDFVDLCSLNSSEYALAISTFRKSLFACAEGNEAELEEAAKHAAVTKHIAPEDEEAFMADFKAEVRLVADTLLHVLS